MLAKLRSTGHFVAGVAVTGLALISLIVVGSFASARRFHGLFKGLFGLMLRAFGMRLRVSGLEHLDPAKGYVYMCNHVNLLEPFILAVALPQWIVGVEKASNFQLPLYGQAIKAWGQIPIERENIQSAIQSLEQAKAALASGTSIVIMPEGTRSRTGALGPFKKGAFHVAIDAKATVVPVAFRGLFDFLRTGTTHITPGLVEVVITPPIEAGDYSKETLQDLSDRVRAQILAGLEGAPPASLEAEIGQKLPPS